MEGIKEKLREIIFFNNPYLSQSMSFERPHILITNDDGLNASGIKHLWNALRNYADITVVAPAYEQSSMGLSTTIRQPLLINRERWDGSHEVWSVTGTPADCVKLALKAILKCRPQLVVSGINRGANMGRSVLYSGTVAAAIESIMQDIPAIAFSCQDYYVEPDFARAEKYIPTIVKHVLEHPMPPGTLLNVNFPERNAGPYKGFKMTSQGKDWWVENPDERSHPDGGRSYYWLGSKLKSYENDDGDGAWLRQGYITAVPIHVGDLTDMNHLKNTKAAFESCFHEH